MCWRKWLAHLMDYVFIFFESSEGRYGVFYGFGGKGVLRLAVGRAGIVSSSLSFTLASPLDPIIIWAGNGHFLFRMR